MPLRCRCCAGPMMSPTSSFRPPSEPPAPPQVQPGDEQILDFLTCSAGASVRAAAVQLGTHREKVRRAVERLRELGRIEFDGEGWLAR